MCQCKPVSESPSVAAATPVPYAKGGGPNLIPVTPNQIPVTPNVIPVTVPPPFRTRCMHPFLKFHRISQSQHSTQSFVLCLAFFRGLSHLEHCLPFPHVTIGLLPRPHTYPPVIWVLHHCIASLVPSPPASPSVVPRRAFFHWLIILLEHCSPIPLGEGALRPLFPAPLQLSFEQLHCITISFSSFRFIFFLGWLSAVGSYS